MVKNKRIIVTGASKGLGSVCAGTLAEHGARLVLIARSEDKLQDVQMKLETPDNHLSIAADLTDMEQLHESVIKAKEFLGKIDGVLHVVGGGLGLRDKLLSAEDLMKLFTLNVSVAAEINRLVVPSMIEQKKGNLVHVCSISSSEVTGSVGYNTVKAALAGYVRSLGREIASSGVVATGILPGGFYAPENSFARMEKNNPEGLKDFIQKQLPRKALGRAEEISPLILMLCSDHASMMGGCLVPIDAGEGRSFFVS